MVNFAFPNKPGIYTLVIEVTDTTTIHIGALGIQSFAKGFYTYTGSALGQRSVNLRNRIQRYLAKRETKHWHIDYLLQSGFTKLRAIIYTITSCDIECVISQELNGLKKGRPIIQRFGSSDCRRGCQAHLCFFSRITFKELIGKIKSVYQKRGFTPLINFYFRG